MSDFPVEGAALKKLVKLSRKQAINFGYNPGTDDNDQFLAAHKRKQPELLGKIARNDGAGTKAAFGTFEVSGSVMTLTCVREVPTLAKRMKKLLRMNKISLNVQVLDQDGNVIDSDIEEMEDGTWFDEADDTADDDADDDDDSPDAVAEPSVPRAGGETRAAVPEAGSAQDLAARLKALQPRIAGLPRPAAEKAGAAYKVAVGLLRGGDLPKAAQSVGQLEAALDRVAAVPGATPTPQTPADPRLAKLREAVEQALAQTEQLPEPAAGPLRADIIAIQTQIDAGEAEAAIAGLGAVQELMKSALAAQARWDKEFAALEPTVNAALSGRTVADTGDLRVKWQYAVGLAGDGAYERAVAALTPVATMLKAGAGEADGDKPPKGVVAFQSSRILWLGARSKMMDEAHALASAITAQGADEEDAAEIAAAGQEIIAEVEQIDARLQGVLDDLTNSPEGREREALKRRAAGIVAEYQSMLGTGIFAMIDQNPFAKVAVAARARAALSTIARSLS